MSSVKERAIATSVVVLAAVLLSAVAASGAVIHKNIKRIVVFVLSDDGSGKPANPRGTGFFVMTTNESNPDVGHGYFVTAKHVLLDEEGKWLPRVWLRFNARDGGVKTGKVDLTGEVWIYTHPKDDNIDIAVIPMLPDRKRFDYLTLRTDDFATKESIEELNIYEGTEVFFTGLFANFFGQKSNQPIVRFGRVALMPSERVPWVAPGRKELVLQELYLLETFSFGGNSGSPVFFYLGPNHNPGSMRIGPPTVKLAGVMSGQFTDARAVEVVKMPRKQSEKANSASVVFRPFFRDFVGIAAVVPAHLLHDILFSDELRTQRKEYGQRRK